MLSLVRIEVVGLLGRFNHKFDFPEDWDFVIIHGPNGIGKTKLLELIHRVLAEQYWSIAAIPFDSAHFLFSDGTHLDINLVTTLEEAEKPSETYAHFTLARPDTSFRWALPHLSSQRLNQLSRMISAELPLSQISQDLWHDETTGQALTTVEVLERYGSSMPRIARHIADIVEPAPEVGKFFQSLDIHFIQTQRLFSHFLLSQSRARDPYLHRRSARVPTSMVLELADDLKRQIAEALAQNSRTSQQLDRVFPRRIITDQDEIPLVSPERIQEKYDEQNTLRRQLADIALLDTSSDVALPKRNLTDFERRVLWAYLGDSQKKLETFIPLLERVTLLTEIVNSRFLYKSMQVDREKGFRFTSSAGTEIKPEALSSGEQHELVLYYNLLFKANKGLVLIDEPEISLHIAWQKKFLNDLSRIALVSNLRFVVATHSPQIINKWWERAVALHAYPEEDEDSS